MRIGLPPFRQTAEWKFVGEFAMSLNIRAVLFAGCDSVFFCFRNRESKIMIKFEYSSCVGCLL